MSESRQTQSIQERRLFWYGPVLMLVAVGLGMMFVGPIISENIQHASREAAAEDARLELKQLQLLHEIDSANRLLAEAVEPSVVLIRVYKGERPSFFGRGSEVGARGSGWIYAYQPEDGGEPENYIVTNHHVISGAERIIVRFRGNDQRERQARVVGYDPKTDIAVLAARGPMIPAAIANEPVRKGDSVFAFGSPFQFDFSMSQGIVSGKGRTLGLLRREQGYEDFIQTDAAINPGNSGGPLTNSLGEVVGMNTAILSEDGGFNGLGFAIPVEMVTTIVDQLIETGRVRRGYLGVTIATLDDDMAETFGFVGRGVVVNSVFPNRAADEAGVQRGDIITHVDGQRVTDADGLRAIIAQHQPGVAVELKVFRDGDILTMNIELDELPEAQGAAIHDPASNPLPRNLTPEQLFQSLGFRSLKQLSEEEAFELGYGRTPGILVREVTPGSVAFYAGVNQTGFSRNVLHLITHVGNQRVTTLEEFAVAISEIRQGRTIRLTIVPDNDNPFRYMRWEDD